MTAYKVPKSFGEYLLKEKNSKFYGFIFPVDGEEAIKLELENLRKLHPKANHHCYAWRLYKDSQFRTNDDGEPSGTAGKPILNQLDSAEITNVLLVVVRYFGGTKLGTNGLITAYKETAKQTILTCETELVVPMEKIKLQVPYHKIGDTLNYLKKINAKVTEHLLEQDYQVVVAQIASSEIEKLKTLPENLYEVKILKD
jgi:uncharacterized YigZ family protein